MLSTRAVLPYLPNICRALLGEELRVPSVETWWCGEADARRRVLSELEGFVVMRTFLGGRPRSPVRVADLASEEREQLRRAIEADPGGFVAQRDSGLATAPAWREGRFEPRPVALRTFAARTQLGYQVMPGGLARRRRPGRARRGHHAERQREQGLLGCSPTARSTR